MGEMLLNGRLYGASGIRELTQAQYDALPASKLTDGVLYCIKDTGIVEGDKYAPIIYSLEEREVGVWTDGKPLYERVFDFSTALSIQPSNWTLTNIDSTNIEKIVYCTGLHSDGTCYAFIGADPTQSTHSKVGVWSARNTTITLKGLILQYTKISDIAGSGSWGTDGVPMVHYDGNEKVIGTWFGETLYEKSGYIPYSHFVTDGYQKRVSIASELSLSNIDIKNYDGYLSSPNFGKCAIGSMMYRGNQDLTHLESAFYYGLLILRSYYNSSIVTNPDNASAAGVAYYAPDLYVTIQYTKTT